MSLKISNDFHPYRTVLKAIKVLQLFKNYVFICVKSAKEIFSSIFILSGYHAFLFVNITKFRIFLFFCDHTKWHLILLECSGPYKSNIVTISLS